MKNDHKIDLEDLPIEVLFKYLLRDYKPQRLKSEYCNLKMKN